MTLRRGPVDPARAKSLPVVALPSVSTFFLTETKHIINVKTLNTSQL